MKIPRITIDPLLTAGIAAILALDLSLAAEPSPQHSSSPEKGGGEDNLPGVAAVVPKLDSRFFKTTTTSYHWEIVEDDDGNLENTLGGQITAEDLLRIEHTADCISSHQGRHLMEFCDAVAATDGVRLTISGGLPAYASDLAITINKKLEFKCAFSAVYPGPTGPLHWKVTRKELKLKSADLKSGTRLRGWISVEFEESDDTSKETHAYKIEGYFKPVIQTPQEEDPSKEDKPVGADHPAAKSADKAQVKDKPSSASKDGPR